MPRNSLSLRKKKGMTIEQARELVTKNNLYLGCMIIKTEGADGQISGALSTTGDTLRPALQIIKCAPGITCVSGAMLLISNQKEFGENGVVVMGDVAVTLILRLTSSHRLHTPLPLRQRAWPDSKSREWPC